MLQKHKLIVKQDKGQKLKD